MKKRGKMSYILISCLLILILIIVYNIIPVNKSRYYENGEISENFSNLSTSDTIISIGTFNAALFYLDIFGKKYFEPTLYSNKRLKLLPAYLRKSNLDIIGLQEVYKKKDKLYLINELKETYPYCIYYKSTRKFGFELNNGLLILSKIPILSSTFSLYKKNPFTEKILADKGILTIKTEVSGKRLVITNTHTTAGGGIYHTESDKTNSIRNVQLDQAIKQSGSYNTTNQIILGDFNSGPGVSEINYNLLINRGFTDTYTIKSPDNNNEHTWDPKNILNNNKYFQDSPPQRIDNIFINKDALKNIRLIETGIILKDDALKIGSLGIPLSDHYGYFCKFRVN